jgi:hypothetical protein
MSEYLTGSFRLVAALALTLALGACGGTFATTYKEPAPAAARSAWRVSEVRIVIPEGLTTTEQNSFIPSADVIWHGDQPGNRPAQAAAIIREGVEQGFAGMTGSQNVVATVTLRRFHSLTPKAYFQAPAGTGVHSVAFDLTVTDRRTGAVLAGPERIEADMPAAVAAAGGQPLDRLPAAEWKKVISGHVAATIRSWLGKGPDIRVAFNRMGA